MNIQGWFPLGLTCLILLPRVSQESSPAPKFESTSSSVLRRIYSYLYMTTGKTIALIIQTFISKVMSLLFDMLFKFVIAFLPRNKHLLISWLQSLSSVILEPKKNSVMVSTFPQFICHEMMGPDATIFFFSNVEFEAAFSLSFHLHQEAL